MSAQILASCKLDASELLLQAAPTDCKISAEISHDEKKKISTAWFKLSINTIQI